MDRREKIGNRIDERKMKKIIIIIIIIIIILRKMGKWKNERMREERKGSPVANG